MGPRKIGYASCDARCCFKTEDTETKFPICGNCKIPAYCSKECAFFSLIAYDDDDDDSVDRDDEIKTS